jgi:hypothetical protein
MRWHDPRGVRQSRGADHKDEQPMSLKRLMSGHNCIDCGYNTFPGAPPRELAEFLMNRDGSVPMRYSDQCEVYIVHDAVWKAPRMEPYGGCLCLEKRIGRRLKPKDFGTIRLIQCREHNAY